ncbi:MAG: deoxyribonuclease V [Planctomycetota bacterium]|jgi:deoxyribonuclease V
MAGLQHDWDLSPKQAIAVQRRLAELIRIEPLTGEIRTIAGVDCALAGGTKIAATAVLCDAGSMAVIAQASAIQPCRFPYIPGLLSFREAPVVIEAVRRLPGEPDLLMCDGQGLAHPRGLGLASHVGLWLDMPTIGVAKSRLCGEHRVVGPKRGSKVQLRHEGEIIGAVVRTRDNVKPLYISVGHRVTLDEAVHWTMACGRGVRLPQPTRLADQAVAQLK